MPDDVFVMKVTQQSHLSVAFTDAKGNPAQVDGLPEWSVSDTTLATIQPDPKGAGPGFGALLAGVGPVGSVQVNVNADADMGDGVKPVMGTLMVNLIAGDAAVAVITPETPTDQP